MTNKQKELENERVFVDESDNHMGICGTINRNMFKDYLKGLEEFNIKKGRQIERDKIKKKIIDKLNDWSAEVILQELLKSLGEKHD
ncbi:MAG: hypothetical protein EHM47_00835 [Ignavibacteriales bacterium]|nr:MAG: hypothetical protein EHM47_00835 [Ignavibacteriales bacterium]